MKSLYRFLTLLLICFTLTSCSETLLNDNTSTQSTQSKNDTTDTISKLESNTSKIYKEKSEISEISAVEFTTSKPTKTEETTSKPTKTEETTSKPTKTEETTSKPTKTQDIEIVKKTNIINPGQTATITIKGNPNIEYNITVMYNSGESTAAGLCAKTTDSNGNVTWSWKVGTRTSAGTYNITIIGGGERFVTTFTVEATKTEDTTSKPTKTEDTTSKPTKTQDIEIVKKTNIINPGQTATITIKGKPNTEYNITVRYKSGNSTAAGLYSKTSDSNGNVTWSWKVGTRTSAGTYNITIIGGGERFVTTFTVT